MGANEAEQDDYRPAYFHVRQFFESPHIFIVVDCWNFGLLKSDR
jgi:hypothetical protein